MPARNMINNSGTGMAHWSRADKQWHQIQHFRLTQAWDRTAPDYTGYIPQSQSRWTEQNRTTCPKVITNDQISCMSNNTKHKCINDINLWEYRQQCTVKHAICVYQPNIHQTSWLYYRVTTCLENLEMSGILLKIREMSCREKILSGKSCLKLFIVNCIFMSMQVFSRSMLCLKC